jgi:hypothetical protein
MSPEKNLRFTAGFSFSSSEQKNSVKPSITGFLSIICGKNKTRWQACGQPAGSFQTYLKF